MTEPAPEHGFVVAFPSDKVSIMVPSAMLTPLLAEGKGSVVLQYHDDDNNLVASTYEVERITAVSWRARLAESSPTDDSSLVERLMADALDLAIVSVDSKAAVEEQDTDV